MAAFQLIHLSFFDQYPRWDRNQYKLRDLETWLDLRIHELECLFQAGKASPYDVDLRGNTLLHVRVKMFLDSQPLTSA